MRAMSSAASDRTETLMSPVTNTAAEVVSVIPVSRAVMVKIHPASIAAPTPHTVPAHAASVFALKPCVKWRTTVRTRTAVSVAKSSGLPPAWMPVTRNAQMKRADTMRDTNARTPRPPTLSATSARVMAAKIASVVPRAVEWNEWMTSPCTEVEIWTTTSSPSVRSATQPSRVMPIVSVVPSSSSAVA